MSRTISGGVSSFFTYSGPDNAIRLRDSGTDFTQSTLGIVGTSTTSGKNATYTRDPDGQLVSTTMADGATHYYLTDNLGSVIALVDGTGTSTATYSYDPYGVTRTTTGPAADANPYRYTGGYRESDTGLYKLGLRYLDPTIGRFSQPDPTRREQNTYLYARAAPCTRTDRTGADSTGENIAEFTGTAVDCIEGGLFAQGATVTAGLILAPYTGGASALLGGTAAAISGLYGCAAGITAFGALGYNPLPDGLGGGGL